MGLTLTNLKHGALKRSSYLIGGAMVSFVALSGVVAVPTLKVDSAREMLAAAEERAEHCAVQRRELEAVRRESQTNGIDAALGKLGSLVPDAPTEIELHSVARLTAKSVSTTLELIGIGAPRDTGWPVLDRHVFARELTISGSGTIPNIIRLTTTLSELGYPCSVSEYSFTRGQGRASQFKFRMALDVYHAGRPTEPDPAESPATDEEMP